MNVAYFYVTEQGEHLAKKIQEVLGGDCYGKENLRETMKMAMENYDSLICIMATGIVVRMIGAYTVHKTKDPAVLVLDQKGDYVISLLSGHLGGANDLAKLVSSITGGQPVITTATDVEQILSFDTFAKEKSMEIEGISNLKYISSAMLSRKEVTLYCNNPLFIEELQERLCQSNFELIEEQEEKLERPTVVISPYLEEIIEKKVLWLRPKVVTIGVGCKKDREEIGGNEAVEEQFFHLQLSLKSLHQIATIPRKVNEPFIQFLSQYYERAISQVTEEEISQLNLEKLGIQQSNFVQETVGVPSVATACAYIVAKEGKILVDKEKYQGFTLSVAIEKEWEKKKMMRYCIRYRIGAENEKSR